MIPGETAATRTPSGPWSWASVRTTLMSPAFAAAYAAAPGSPWCPESLAMTTITPPPASTIGARAACIVKKAPLRHVSRTASQSSSLTSSVGRSSQTPAQWTSTSSCAYRSMVAVTSARQSPTSRTSPVTHPCLPSGSRLSATVRVFASSRPATMTAQPSAARRRAHASPIPDEPPVTRTTLSARPSTMTSAQGWLGTPQAYNGRAVSRARSSYARDSGRTAAR